MMAERPDPAALPANKAALSRALGAAFLNHQVEQLEKSVASGPASGNWRDRRQAPLNDPLPNSASRRTANGTIKLSPQQQSPQQKTSLHKKKPTEVRNGEVRLLQEEKPEKKRTDKDADVIIVDASVLVHAIHQVKLWCRNDRTELVIIPLEALNTLDLLKKGTSVLAQRARAASRILEAQVGANSRIIVQRDDAFVLWDKILFQDSSSPPSTSPEWVRRIICCAKWEVDEGVADGKKVVLAVSPLNATSHVQHYSKVDDPSALISPVPLPAPHHKFEPRSAGVLVAHWAKNAGLEILDIKPSAATAVDDEPERSRRKGRKPSSSFTNGDGGMVKRPPAVLKMMEMVSQPNKAVRVLARGEKLDPDP